MFSAPSGTPSPAAPRGTAPGCRHSPRSLAPACTHGSVTPLCHEAPQGSHHFYLGCCVSWQVAALARLISAAREGHGGTLMLRQLYRHCVLPELAAAVMVYGKPLMCCVLAGPVIRMPRSGIPGIMDKGKALALAKCFGQYSCLRRQLGLLTCAASAAYPGEHNKLVCSWQGCIALGAWVLAMKLASC